MPDMVTMQVIRYALEQVADEMGYTLVRTGRSTLITEIKDLSCVVVDAGGQTVAQSRHNPSMLAGFETIMRELLTRYRPADLIPGDVIVTNDPYKGGQHIMDLCAISPVFLHAELIGFVGNIVHHSDLGGVAAGGVAGGLREIYLEGLRLPMVKLVKAGVEDTEIFGIIANQIRLPDKTLGDIRAQMSALLVGRERLTSLYRRYGRDTVVQASNDLLDYSERRMRQGIAALPDGSYCGEDFLDDDGVNDRPIRVHLTVRIEGSEVSVDLTGSDAQAEGNVNSPIANTLAAVYYVMISLVDPGVPPNSGCYRPIKVLTRKGSIVDPLPPAAVAARTNTSQKIVEALLRAMATVVPERVMAGSHGQISTCGFGGRDPHTNAAFVYTDIQGGGSGARAYRDGRDGQDSHLPRFMNTPVEIVEKDFPVRIERYEFLPDSGGAGKFRGGLSTCRDIRLLTDRISFARYGDRHRFAPQGLFGGREGSVGRFVVNPSTPHERVLASKGLDILSRDELLRLQMPGAGGYGNPADRELAAVDADLRDGKISAARAASDYDVVLDATGALDLPGTIARRKAQS
jgi:N-methylhydantoinase B